MIDSTFAFDIKNLYEQAHPKLIRNWKKHISTIGKYNKAMIQDSNILQQSDLIEKLVLENPSSLQMTAPCTHHLQAEHG